MPRQLTSATTLDNLRKEAKRWLKALRENDAEALERLQRAHPKVSSHPVLRDVQHALAREYGLQNWKELNLALKKASAEDTKAPDNEIELAARFLEFACSGHHVRLLTAHQIARYAAMRIQQDNPGIALETIYTAAVCGEIEEVERILRERPRLANAKHSAAGRDRSGAGGSSAFLGDSGAKAGQPLLSRSFPRLPLPQANDNALAIARLLLDRGADPNAYFM